MSSNRPCRPGTLSSVPSANVEVVRSIYADWERGDYGSVEWAHPEIEYVIADGPAPSARYPHL
jgi:ketosteroid isomerase-like protein